jgi:Ribbon-helix-helix protein, copG family.
MLLSLFIMKMTKKRLYITLYPDTLEKLNKISKKKNRSRSAMIEKLINDFSD